MGGVPCSCACAHRLSVVDGVGECDAQDLFHCAGNFADDIDDENDVVDDDDMTISVAVVNVILVPSSCSCVCVCL